MVSLQTGFTTRYCYDKQFAFFTLNFEKSPVCAIKMIDQIDAGPIYMKRNIKLNGNLTLIFQRISSKIIEMIKTNVIKALSKLDGTFTRQDIQKQIWIAQGNKLETYVVRQGYYADALQEWVKQNLIQKLV